MVYSKSSNTAVKFFRDRGIYIFYAYTLILLLMNFIRIFDCAYWGDEAFSIALARMTVPEMIEATAQDVHPPLYYLFLQFLYRILGDHGYTYHLSALIPYAGILILGVTVIRKRFGIIPPLIMNTMISILFQPLRYNVEIRMYALAAFLVLLSYLALYEILKQDRLRDWLIFFFSSIAAAYTHYYALIYVAFFYLTLLIMMLKRRSLMKRTLILCAVTIACYVPWLFVLIGSFVRTAGGWWATDIPSVRDILLFVFDGKYVCLLFALVLAMYLARELGIVSFGADAGKMISNGTSSATSKESDNAMSNGSDDRSGAAPDTALVSGEELASRSRAEVKTGKLRFLPSGSISFSDEAVWVLSGMCSFAGTVLVGTILSLLVRPFFVDRYCFPILPVIYLIFGYCMSRLSLRRWLAAFALVLLFVLEMPIYLNMLRTDWNLNAETQLFLENVQPSEDALIVTDNYYMDWTQLDYYYPDNARSYAEDELPAALDTSYDEVWLFLNNELTPDQAAAYEENGFKLNFTYDGDFAGYSHFYVYEYGR